tara:strand:- start:5257 stop:6054 length:798 start_codon:yes stop_codon:yes gene_type:complete
VGKGILYSVISITLYYLIITGFGYLITFIFTTEYFLNVNEAYFLFIDSIIYLIFICLAIFFIRKFSKTSILGSKISPNFILKILFFIIIFRFMEDPMLNIDIVFGNEIIPVGENQNSTITMELISTFLGIVLLGPIFEELFFRQIILSFFGRKYLITGVLVSSVLFALIHINISSINYISVILSFAFGIVACLIYFKKGLYYSILFHVGYNFFWFLLKEFRFEYWSILKKLDFGIGYWLITIGSLIAVLYFSYSNFKRVIYKEDE